MPFKLTMIFQQTTTPTGGGAVVRTGGWTESVYSSGLGPGTRGFFLNLCAARAALLPVNAAIVGQRYQAVLPTGGSSTGAQRFPGTIAGADAFSAGDVPQMALLCRTTTGGPNIRPTYLRGLPDALVIGGEYSPTTAFTTALNNFFTVLQGFAMLGRPISTPPLPIFSVSETGLVSFNGVQTVTVPGVYRISGSVDSEGLRKTARVRGVSQPTTSSLQVEGWHNGACVGGKLVNVTPSLIVMSTSSVSRVVVKKVGRAPFQYRGRRSKRR